jgi:hypothetical protein
MNVTRDIIDDLLPLYIAGEASPGTTQLVTEYLARDPGLANEVRRQQQELSVHSASPVRPDLEMTALRRTRRLLSARQWSFGLAWFFTALSMSVEVNRGSGHYDLELLVIEYWYLFWWLPLTAVVFWIAYLRLKRTTRL